MALLRTLPPKTVAFHDDLFRLGLPLIHFVEETQKWSDEGNDHKCYRDLQGHWVVYARYGFVPDREIDTIDFGEDEKAAMTFFVNYLVSKRFDYAIALQSEDGSIKRHLPK